MDGLANSGSYSNQMCFVFCTIYYTIAVTLGTYNAVLEEVGLLENAIFANCLCALELKIVIKDPKECLSRIPNGHRSLRVFFVGSFT